MDDIVLKSNPKFCQYFDENIIRNLDQYRGTKFRGVSRNGRNSWQILAMIEGQKVYLATVNNILCAAIIFDILSVQTKGLRAKTNFHYSKLSLLVILNLNTLIMQ